MILTGNIRDHENLPPREKAYRVLVMRKWPRGVPRDTVDLWMKELGASPETLREFKRGRLSAAAFQAMYFAEIQEPGRRGFLLDLQRRIRELGDRDLLLLCDGEDEDHSVRAFLKEILETS